MYKLIYIDTLDKLYVKNQSFDNLVNAIHFMTECVTKQNQVLELKYYSDYSGKKENRT